MKTLRLLFIFTAALIFAVSCSEEENADLDMLSAKKTLTYDMDAWRAAMPGFCGPIQFNDLIGGQTIMMGSVAVANDGTHLYVKYEADPGYEIIETHLFIGDVMGEDFPKGKKDNVKIGHFPYASENYDGSIVVVYKIPLADIKGDCFDVAAHAVVMCEDGSCEETAWGAGRSSELVLTAKAYYTIPSKDNWYTYGLTEGVMFAENCTQFHWGYIPIDIENFEPGTYNISMSTGTVIGTISTNIIADKLVLSIDGIDGNIVGETYLFIGLLNDLYNLFTGECPAYYSFPYLTSTIEIPLSDLPSTSEDAMDLGATRWGFYFDYCLTSCD